MPLFQQSVQKKFIAELDKVKVENAYQRLIAHFGNPTIQANIRNAKEEQYQEGFLRELFVDVFGYVLNPQPNFNLITEQKNEKDSKKADGAILKNTSNGFKPIGIIELKSVKTTDLQSIEIQAFSYKNNQSDCIYVVTSNFQKIRFYIENAIDFEEFDLFDISKERFALLYLCLHADSVLADTPLRVKKLSVEKEESITNTFYKEYSDFKKVLFEEIVKHNKQHDKFLLYKKTQKLLDRFLFIFFAEDKGLLPPNTVVEITNDWEKLKDLDEYQPLYSRFKKYFGYLNFGHVAKNYTIFAYNGGLFAPDELLDGLIIPDNMLYNRTRFLAHYDYDTDIDTNILGHIFEHSLNEMDEIEAESKGFKPLEKISSKRKKDGVFYTPRYITKYIVESTIGELCQKEKITLGLDNETLIKIDTKKDKKVYQEKIQQYRDWLLQLTILDPACGSGAFLNQALEFLMEEHRQIDSMTAMLFGDTMLFTDNVTEILENNIFGVDINEESVEIARLSLWLRTAKVGRKLNDLSRNIKCGNSLISDVAVAGDLAFDWKAAFPQVFEKGGFDVVIGNPPYVFARGNMNVQEKEYYMKEYVSTQYQINTYMVFMEKSISLLKNCGYSGLIVPNSWLMISSAQKLRSFLLENTFIDKIVNLSGNSFEDANVETIILINAKSNTKKNNAITIKQNQNQDFIFLHDKNQNSFLANDNAEFNIYTNDISFDIIKKMINNSEELDTVASVKAGLQAYEIGKGNPKQTAEDVKNRPYDFKEKVDYNTFPYLEGKDVNRYFLNWSGNFLQYGEQLASPRNFEMFSSSNIIIREITGNYPKSIIAMYCEETYLFNRSNIAVLQKDKNYNLKYITCILNSQLMSYYFLKNTPKSVRQLFPKIILVDLRKFPIKKLNNKEQEPYISLTEKMLLYNADLQKHTTRFLKLLQSSFSNLTVNKKLETWYNLTFGEFRKELEKQKIAIPIKELMDYQELFDNNKETIQALQTKINQTEKTIDRLVYQLYELTAEEIQIIENQ